MAQISLGWKNGEENTLYGFKVTVKKENYKKYNFFNHSTYTITKASTSSSIFNFIEFVYYKGYQPNAVLTYHFSRYEVENVQVYTSVYEPYVPLILIVIFTKDKITKCYQVNSRKHISFEKHDESNFDDLFNAFIETYKKANKEFKILDGNGSNENVHEKEDNLYTHDKKTFFKKVTYKSNTDNTIREDSASEYQLFLNNLFTNKTTINVSVFNELKNESQDAIFTYHSTRSDLSSKKNTLLLVQFVHNFQIRTFSIKWSTLSRTVQWREDFDTHENDEKLINKLLILQEQLFSSITVCMDKTNSYSKEDLQSSTSLYNVSIFQPDPLKVLTFQKLEDSSNYNFIQHTVTPNLNLLLKKLSVNGKSLDKIKDLEDFSRISQLEDKIKKFVGKEEEFVLTSLQNYIFLELNLFISNIKITTYKQVPNQNAISPLTYFDSARHLFVYFYLGSKEHVNVPLVVRYNDKYYGPTSRAEYFTKWILLTATRGEDSHAMLKNHLHNTNKLLNEIDISEKTDQITYGISKPDDPKGIPDYFYDRVIVRRVTNNHFIMVTHSTTNRYQIGEIKNGSKKLVGFSESHITNEINKLCVYYSVTDDDLKFPFIISLTSESVSPSTKWFYRSDLSGDKWEKSTQSKDDDNNEKIKKRILELKRKFLSPLIVKIDQQHPYIVRFEASETESISPKDHNIVVDRNGLSTSSSVSPYTCFRHNLNEYYTANIENIKARLKLQPSESDQLNQINFELMLELLNIPLKLIVGSKTKLCLGYKKDVNDLLVFFSDNKTGNDSVPLMFSYDNKFYTPVSKVKYFIEWTQSTGITGLTNVDQIKSELDTINKMLNEIDISNTNENGYGIPEPEDQPLICSKSFCTRVNVKLFKGNCYRKITHSTSNHRMVGNIYFKGRSVDLNGLNTLEKDLNQVCVYYLSCDIYYRNPLFFKIFTDSPGNTSHLYHRTSDGVNWIKHDQNQFSSDSNIKSELTKLSVKNQWKLHIQLQDNRAEYEIEATYGDYASVKKYTKRIAPSIIGTYDGIDVDGYRYYAQGLRGYYEANRSEILKLFPTEGNLTLELVMNICHNKIELVNSNGHITSLEYTNNDFVRNTDLNVYFSKNDSNPYEVPLMIKYETRFFAPRDKNSYFTTWYEISKLKGITGPRIDADKMIILNNKLHSLLNMFNEIDPTQTRDYGIPYFTQAYYFKHNFFITKRVEVKNYKHPKYKIRVHRFLKGNSLSNIKSSDKSEFTDHKSSIKDTINEVILVFPIGDINNFKIMFLNYKSDFNLTTYGYYYEKITSPLRRKTIEFQYLKSFPYVISFHEDNIQFMNPDDKDLTHIKSILSQLSGSKIPFDKEMKQTDTNTKNNEERDRGAPEIQSCQDQVTAPLVLPGPYLLQSSHPGTSLHQTSLRSELTNRQDHSAGKSQETLSVEIEGRSDLSQDSGSSPLTSKEPIGSQTTHNGEFLQEDENSLRDSSVDLQETSRSLDHGKEPDNSKPPDMDQKPNSDSERFVYQSKNSLPETEVSSSSLQQRTPDQEEELNKKGLEKNLYTNSGSPRRNIEEFSVSLIPRNGTPASANDLASNQRSDTGSYEQLNRTYNNNGSFDFTQFLNDNKIYLGSAGGGVVTASVGSLIIYKLVKKSRK